MPQSGLATRSSVTVMEKLFGNISSVTGAKSTAAPSRSAKAASAAPGRGYFAKSSLAPNCSGLTNTDSTTS